MSEIIVGTKLQSTKSNVVATVVEINKKCKQAIVDLSDGSNRAYSLATLKDKRSWTIIDNDDEYVEEIMQQKKELGIECPEIKSYEVVEENHLVPMPGIERLEELKKEVSSSMIDPEVFAKFVKKAQRLITQATHDSHGYHVTINVNGKDIFYHDKNLQNIRSAIGHIYRGEVEV